MSAYIEKLINDWSTKSSFPCPLQWAEIGCKEIPTMQYHAGCIIDEFFYLHGGSSTKIQFDQPVNTFYRYSLKNNEMQDLSGVLDTPALSNHACCSIFNRYLILIGGWNGNNSISTVHIFDTKFSHWIVRETKGLPAEMEGLTCHTVNILHLENGGLEFLVTCSNGMIRKHHSMAFKLVPNKELTIWRFIKLTNRGYFQLNHQSACLSRNVLYCVGGNNTRLLQKLLVYNIFPDPTNELVTNLMTYVAKNYFSVFTPIAWTKEATRGHCVITGKDGFLLLNGMKYCTNTTDYRKNVYAFLDLGKHKGFFYVGDINERLAYGVCALDTNTGVSYYHGGLSQYYETNNRLFQLTFFFEECRRGLLYQRLLNN